MTTTELRIEPTHAGGSVLIVTQDGFPCEAMVDAHYASCEVGWRDTFELIRRASRHRAPYRSAVKMPSRDA